MSLFDRVKDAAERAGILVDDDAEKPKEEAAKPVATFASSEAITPSTPYKASNDNVAGGVSDPKYVSTLQKEIDKVCSDKYRTFLDRLTEMGKIPGMSPSSIFQAAMIAAGISIEEIKQSHEVMLTKLGEEESAFARTVETKHQDMLTQSTAQIKTLDDSVKANNAKIEELNKLNQEAFTQMNSLKAQIADGETRTNNQASSFRASVAEVRAMVEQARNQAAQNSNITGGVK